MRPSRSDHPPPEVWVSPRASVGSPLPPPMPLTSRLQGTLAMGSQPACSNTHISLNVNVLESASTGLGD